MKRLVLIADERFSAQVIGHGLRHASECQVVGFVCGRRACAAEVQEAAPDVVVVVSGPAGDDTTLDRLRDAREGAPSAKIVLLTASTEPGWLEAATAAGADAAIARTVHPVTLGVLVREIAAGSVYHTPAAARGRDPHRRVTGDLTPRELQILRLTASGAVNSRIARDLWVTEQTVKFHLSNIYRKLGVSNRTEASHYAHTHGLLEPAEALGANRRAYTAAVAA